MSDPNWQGQYVRLRAVEPDDWSTFWTWDQDSEMARRSYFVPFPRSRDATRRWAEAQAATAPNNDEFRLVIENQAGDMVGTINSHSCEPRNGTFGYGLGIAAEHRRKGYAADAIRLVLRYFFGELRYQKATVHVYSFNEASIRLHERLGFQLEGRIRRMIYSDGQYWDDLIFGLLHEEFTAASAQLP